jgi:hypothetical protein
MVIRWPGVIKPGTAVCGSRLGPHAGRHRRRPQGQGLERADRRGPVSGIVKTTLDGVTQRDFLAGTSEKLAAIILPTSRARRPTVRYILVIMGDDICYWNISAYMMGYRTPNIDRIASEGAIFTDYYGQQSCTADQAASITGQSPLRTGLRPLD